MPNFFYDNDIRYTTEACPRPVLTRDELRYRELESRNQSQDRFIRDLDLAKIMEASKDWEPKTRKKIRKPLRAKKLRPVIKCTDCGHILDKNGNLCRYNDATYCKSCWKKRFYKCLICGRHHRRGSRSKPIRICTRCKERLQRRAQPQRVGDISWRKGDTIIGLTSDVIGSKRAFGLEFETHACPWAERLEGKTPFGCKYDSTVEGREFDSPIMSGDEGLTTALDFCDLAKSRGWRVDNRCGTHLHLDMRNEEDRKLKGLALAYLRTFPVWASMVEPRRMLNSYCGGVSYTAQQLLDYSYRDFASNQGRYQFINHAAYLRHTTIEIRGLQGTLDKALISNWVKAHLRFADYVLTQRLGDLERQFNRPEQECWYQLRKHIGTGPARFWGRVRANRMVKLALDE